MLHTLSTSYRNAPPAESNPVSCALSIKSVTVRYAMPDGDELQALGPVTCDIAAGEFVSLVGPSGCGKSTLIRVIAGLARPTNGQVYHDDVLMLEPSPRMGLMFQQANLMPWRTVLDNVALPLEIAGVPRQQRHAEAYKLLDFLGLQGFGGVYPGALSGGMAQRVALGRVLSQNPDVLLLDEPFGALDAFTREQLSFDLLKIRQGQTVLMVTHDIREAVLLSDRVLVMSQRPGRILADIPVRLERPRTPEQAYLPEFIEISRQVRDAIQRA